MAGLIVYVDHSEIREGRAEELSAAIAELARLVEVNEPRLLAYAAYFDEQRTRMTVIHVHSDAASLDFHLDVAGAQFSRFSDLVRLLTIEVFGEPSAHALDLMKRKAETLGNGTVVVHRLGAGFVRSTLQGLAAAS